MGGKQKQKRALAAAQEPSLDATGHGATGHVSAFKLLLTLSGFAVLALAIYANTLNNEFVFDDIPLIVKNNHIEKLENIPNIFGLTGQRSWYRPLRIASYALDYQFFKLDPKGYHLANIFYHVATAWLVFLITCKLVKNYTIALSTALLFIVHPVNTDSVTYISGRRDILSTLFYLLGFLLFLKYREKPKALLCPCIMLSYLLALSAKEMAVTLPATFFVYDFIKNFPEKADGSTRANAGSKVILCCKTLWRKYTLFYLCFFLAAVISIYYKLVVAPPSGHQYWGGALWANFFTVARVLLYYLRLLLFPIPLNADYSFNAFPVTTTVLDIYAWLSFLTIGVLVWICLKVFFFNRIVVLGFVWFFLTILPVCQIIPHHELLAEHYLYLPSIGIFLGIATFLHNVFLKKSAHLFFVFLLIFIGILAVRTIDRNRDWKNPLTLWEKSVKTAPDCARAWNNLGVAYYQAGAYEKAEQAYQRALQIKPVYADPYHNLGNLLADRNLFDQAIAYYQQALQYSPSRSSKKREIFNSWGVALKNQGKLNAAMVRFYRTVKYAPYFGEARNNLGAVLYALGHYSEAQKELQTALEIEPAVAEVHNNLGNVYQKTGYLQQAVEEFNKAIQLKPDFMEAYNNLGIVLKKQGLYQEAIKSFKRSIELKQDSAEVYTNLGNAYRKTGQIAEALNALHKAVQLNPTLALPHQNLAMIYLFDRKDNNKALLHLKKTIELDPAIPQAQAIQKKIAELTQAR